MVSNRCLMIHLNVVWSKSWEPVEQHDVKKGVIMMALTAKSSSGKVKKGICQLLSICSDPINGWQSSNFICKMARTLVVSQRARSN